MYELPIWRVVVLGVACAFVSSAAGFIACWVTNANIAISIVATGAVLAVSMYFTMRWWLTACRKAGVETFVEWTDRGASYVLAILAMFVVGIAADFYTYARFGDRLLQFAIAAAIAVPTGFIIGWIAPRLRRKARAGDAKLLRFNFIMILVQFVIMTGNAVLQLHMRDYPELATLKNFTIALYFFILPTLPMQAYVAWRWSVEANEAVGSTPSRA